jgi:hypothetical protein
LDTELQPKGFEAGDPIQIVDTSLSGKSTANDIEVSIIVLNTPPSFVEYPNIKISIYN